MKPESVRNIGVNGLVRESAVDSNLIPAGAVTDSVNFHFDRIGAATVRPGLAALGSTVLNARPCVGLFNAQSGTALAVFSNGGSSTIYSFSGGAWGVSLDGGTASVAIRFVDFGSYTIAVNFISNTESSMRFWNAGSSRHWHNTGNPINPQNMWGYNCQLGEVYKSRVYLGGDISGAGGPSRLFFSSVITSAGNITWNPTTDFVDINPGDGEGMTALKRYSLELLVFKPNYIYRFKTSGVDPDALIKIGTRSHESVIEGKKGLYFHHDSGIYRYTGGYPTEISRPVSDIIDAIPLSQYSAISAWHDQDHVYWSIGTVTIAETKENITYKNAILRYTESSGIWTVYSHSSDIRRGMDYNNGSTLTRLVGTDYGVAATYNSGVTDIGEPIRYRIRTKWYEWENIVTRKTLQEFTAICEKSQGALLMYKTDETTEWKPVVPGQLTGLITPFYKQNITFHRIKFQVTGVARFDPPVFLGFEILQGTSDGLIKDK